MSGGNAVIRFVWVTLALAALFGCEVSAPIQRVSDPDAAWRLRQAALAELTHWTAVGRIGISTDEEAWSASIRWEQQGDTYQIRLSGPLGQGVMQVQGRPGRAELRTADRQVHVAEDADALLRARTGFKVPLSVLRYWILGTAGPGAGVDDLVVDGAGRLQQLRQAGWVLEVERYGGPEKLALPTKLEASTEGITARVVVTRWLVSS